MKATKLICVSLVFMATGVHVRADTKEPEVTSPVLRVSKAMTNDALGAPVAIEFEGSERLTEVLRLELESRGYRVNAREGERPVSLSLHGRYAVRKPGTPAVIGELVELPQSKDVVPEGVNTLPGRQVVLEALLAKAIPVTSLLTYLSQKSGVAGWFNNAVVGDPRGICLVGNCDMVVTHVVIYVKGTSPEGNPLMWRVESTRGSDKFILDEVIAASLAEALAPLPPPQANDAREAGK